MKWLLAKPRAVVAAIVVLLLGYAGIYAWLLLSIGVVGANDNEKPRFFFLFGICWLLFSAAVFLLFRAPARALPALIVLGSLLLGGTSMLQRPITSTDSARYNWDGIVQNAGVDPYLYVPADARLAYLRPHWLFQDGSLQADGTLKCHAVRSYPTTEVGSENRLCTGINRPHVPTIYPPVAEGLFALTRLLVPASVAWLPMQALGLLAVLATTVLLLYELRRLGRNRVWAAAWAWCPFVILEGVNNAHIDIAAVAFAVAGTMLVARKRMALGGVLMGLAIATKFLPAVLLPPLVRQKPLRMIGAVLGVVVAVYLPHLIVAGSAVIGYLPGYLQEEGYDGGSRAVLLSLVLPGAWSTFAAAAVLAVLALMTLRHADSTNPWAAQALLLGATLLLLTPRYPWYALLLVPLILLGGRFEWVPVILLLEVRELYPWPLFFQIGYALALLIVVVVSVLRQRERRQAESDLLWRVEEAD